MKIADLFPSDRIFLRVAAADRKALFAFLSERAAELGLVQSGVCVKALHIREELGSTGLGNGIAIPHARVEGVDRVVGLLATLAKPIDFEAVDGEPVDLVMMLIMPEQSGGEQLKALQRIARHVRDEANANALRSATIPEEVTALLEAADEAL
jgi:Phosphotransferase system mannitol/fructose-specific IIA domain (Ntr-type)